MSSPAGLQCSQTPSNFRAGVILSPCPHQAAPVGRLSCSPFPGPHDSFSSHFAPLPASVDSSCVAQESLNLWTQMELNKAGCEQQVDEGDQVDSLAGDMGAQSEDVSLVMKLEQLRQWQQHMQEQLRAQQLQELLRLQQEQHRLLDLMNTQPQDTAANVEELSGADWGENTLHSSTLCHVQTIGRAHTESPEERPLTGSPQPLLRGPSQDHEGPAIKGVCCVEEQSQTSPSRISAQGVEPQDSSTHEEASVGDRPINPGCADRKTFEELLEEQLKLEEKRLKSVQQPQSNSGVSLTRPKRAFLKRGEGLLRFTGRKLPTKDPRPLPPAKAIIRSHSEPISLQQGQTGCALKLPVQRKTASVCKGFQATTSLSKDMNTVRLKILQSHLRLHTTQSDPVQRLSGEQAYTMPAEPTALRAPCGGNLPEEILSQGVSTQTESKEPGQKSSAQEQGGAKDSLERSFQERLLHWESAQQQESVELGEFELLEQAAEELSFSSNSSFVVKVLQMDQQKRLQQHRLSSTPVKSPPNTKDPPKHSPCESEENQKDKQVPSVPNVYSFPSQSSPPYNKCSYEDMDSCQDFSEAAESDSEDCTIIKQPEEEAGEQPGGVLFDDNDTWSQLSEDHGSNTASLDEPASPVQRAVFKAVKMEKQPAGPGPSQLMSRLFPALKTQSLSAPVSHAPSAADPRSVPSTTHAQQAQSQLLRERLVELEVQIERFKTENAALTKLRKDNQKLQEELRRDRCEFEQMKAQEISRFEEYKREESRKFQRERRLLEKHMSAARAVPNKSERHEIQALKQQLSSLQEELRRKESRWANTHSRQRHQLEALGQDNCALREEVKTLEKLRLTTWKKNSTDSSAPKGVKFATPLDSISGPQNSSDALATRGSRRASAPGAATVPTGMKSSLRTPSLTERRTEDLEPSNQSQSSLSPEVSQGCSLGDTQLTSDCESRLQTPQEDALCAEGKVEEVLSSGARFILFSNGTKKEVSPDGRTVKVTFFNGDTKELTADQRVIYYYAEAKTTHITYPDGLEVLHFSNNQTEKHFPDGHKEITFPDHSVKTLYPNGREETVLTDGTIIQVHPDGSKEIHFNTGQREVHTAEYKRREYPDGTVKTVYSDGRQETQYPTGRLRIKDREGNVILDNQA